MASFISSQRGARKLVYEGFIYSKSRDLNSDGLGYWRCELRKCKGAVTFDTAENVMIIKRGHDHPPSPTRVEVARIRDQVRRAAELSTAKAGEIIRHNLTMANLEEPEKLTSLKKENLKVLVRRKRRSAAAKQNEKHDAFPYPGVLEMAAANQQTEMDGDMLDFDYDAPAMRSAIWTCFITTETQGEAQCRYCSKILVQVRGSTKGLWDHLKSNHKAEFAQLRQNQQMTAPSTSNVATKQQQNVDLDQLFAQQGNPQMEVIQVQVKTAPTKPSPSKRAKVSVSGPTGARALYDFPSRGSSEVSSQGGPGNVPAVSHILVWSALSHEQNNPTYIMANLMDDEEDPLHGGHGELTIASVIQRKLNAKTEPSGCCFSTRMPANIVLNEFSNLGYRAIGMVNKRVDEVLWTLAKNN